jgi:hypothetical protein
MSNTINLDYHRRVLQSISGLRGRGRLEGGGNDCFKPARDAGTKQDLMDLHRDEMRERFKRQFTRTPTHRLRWINQHKKDKAYLSKSIWPDGKVAKPGRMG